MGTECGCERTAGRLDVLMQKVEELVKLYGAFSVVIKEGDTEIQFQCPPKREESKIYSEKKPRTLKEEVLDPDSDLYPV